MNLAQSIRDRSAQALADQLPRITQLKAFIGFDGFVDEIVHLVSQRHDAERFDRLPTLNSLGERILAAAGQSTNIEGVVQQMKLGGNGPILANALAALGVQVTYLGALGWPQMHPVFDELSRRARVHTIAPAGHTDALEFEDGKLMITKTVSLNELTWKNIVERFGQDKFQNAMTSVDLVGFVNWTMIPFMSDLWERILQDICPSISDRQHFIFFDLADPEKRTKSDIRRALKLVQRFNQFFKAILGLNEKEAWEIASVLDLNSSRRDDEALSQTAVAIARQLDIDTLVVHPVSQALAVRGGQLQKVDGPFEPRPKITTGAGDHFNAGFCLGKLCGLELECCLMTGVATSGFYVRTARSPSVADLTEMLRHWPAPN